MAQPPRVTRLRTEDFPQEYRQIIERISYAWNEFMDQVIFVLDRKVDFRNLNQQIVDISVSIDGSGNVINPPSINASNIQGKVIGVYPINAVNNNDPAIIPTSQPFVQFTIAPGTVSILNISGLQANSEYTLKLLLIGDNISGD